MLSTPLRRLFPLALVLLAACSDGNDATDARTEEVGDGVFRNEAFGMTVQKPDGWYAQSFDEMIQAHQMGANMLSGDDENMKASLESALESTLPLFTFFKKPPGTPGDFNPNVIASAENIDMYSEGIKTGCDYLANMVKVLEQSQVQFEVDGDCGTTDLNGQTFGVQSISMSAGSQTVNQRFLACRSGDHAIGIVQSYMTEKQRDEVNGVVDSLEIDCDATD